MKHQNISDDHNRSNSLGDNMPAIACRDEFALVANNEDQDENTSATSHSTSSENCTGQGHSHRNENSDAKILEDGDNTSQDVDSNGPPTPLHVRNSSMGTMHYAQVAKSLSSGDDEGGLLSIPQTAAQDSPSPGNSSPVPPSPSDAANSSEKQMSLFSGTIAALSPAQIAKGQDGGDDPVPVLSPYLSPAQIAKGQDSGDDPAPVVSPAFAAAPVSSANSSEKQVSQSDRKIAALSPAQLSKGQDGGNDPMPAMSPVLSPALSPAQLAKGQDGGNDPAPGVSPAFAAATPVSSTSETIPRLNVIGAFAVGGGSTTQRTKVLPGTTSAASNHVEQAQRQQESSHKENIASTSSQVEIDEEEQQPRETFSPRSQDDEGIRSSPSESYMARPHPTSDDDLETGNGTETSTANDEGLAVLQAWEVHIDEDDTAPVVSVTNTAEAVAGSTMDIVQAEKSSEDHLRRCNHRLMSVLIVLVLVVASILVGVTVYMIRSKDAKEPSNNITEAHSSHIDDPQRESLGGKWVGLGLPLVGDNASEEFGSAVALASNGKTLAVGAWGYDNYRGRVEILEYDAWMGTWVPIGSVLGRLVGNQLGVSLEISDDGTTLVAGANQYNMGETANRTGLLRVFERVAIDTNGTGQTHEWVQKGSDIMGIDEHEQFGWRVAMSADGTIVAGAAKRHGKRMGYIRAFKFNEMLGEWEPMGSAIFGSNPGDQFGASLSLSSDGLTLVGGADENDASGMNAGQVRVFHYTRQEGGDLYQWVLRGQALEGIEAKGDFGYSVSMCSDASTIAAGAWEHQESRGYVKVFMFDEATQLWKQKGSTLFGASEGSQYGIAVKLSDDGQSLLVGANEYHFGLQDWPGRAHVYRYIDDNNGGGDWFPIGQPLVGDAADDRFGWDLDIADNASVIAVSAYRNDANGDRSGQVRVFELIHD